MIELIPETGHFYKVNMHCHTNISDGRQTPEEIKEEYKKRGYSAVCFTDHEVLLPHEDLCDDEFVALHGYEVAIKSDLKEHTGFFMPVYHFNLIAKDPNNLTMTRFFEKNPSFPGNSEKWARKFGQYSDVIDTTHYDIDWINGYLKAVSEAGFLVNYNHPEWSLQSSSDYTGLKYLHSIEVINGSCSILHDNTSLHFQRLLRSGHRVVPTGGDDNHDSDSFGTGWTMIKAPELSYKALIAAYERGDCYASDGPEIFRLVLSDGKIIVKTSPVVGIFLHSEGRFCLAMENGGDLLTDAEFEYMPERFGSYFRIEVRDAQGNRAFSNAYYTKTIAEPQE